MLALTKKQIENLMKWRDELKSGKYKQTRKILKLEDSDGELHYCCLGVALELFNNTSTKSHTGLYHFTGHGFSFPDYDWFYDTFGLPQEIFSTLNDRGVSFDVISHVISVLINNHPFIDPDN